jgi:hypothetical protein
MTEENVREENQDQGKKQILLRLNSTLWQELSAWAKDDFRSINGQIEFLLSESVKKYRRSKPK